MRRILTNVFFAGTLVAVAYAGALAQQQIRVHPDGVNINAQGSSVVFLTFGGLTDQGVAEGCWCGELMPAAPDIGLRCNPATIFGCLPARLDLSRRSGSGGFTDIMSIPPSVARRAYQSALSGQTSSFFYVRRFTDPRGGPDQFVPVTCRMTGGGARTPFALTDVSLSFAMEKPVLLVKRGETLPPIKAEIAYNGTGRLKGRWEVVLPGDEPPAPRDLLTEATLPAEERGRQQRYTQLSRFNVFLPPTGRYTLPGPDPKLLPSKVEGQYLILLRVEASDDKEGDSNLAAAGAGSGIVHSGAVAGFPLPPLRYFVGGDTSKPLLVPTIAGLSQLAPAENYLIRPGMPLEFSWSRAETAAFYRVDIANEQRKIILSALLPSGLATYQAPPWLNEKKAAERNLQWRVVALGQEGNPIGETSWRILQVSK